MFSCACQLFLYKYMMMMIVFILRSHPVRRRFQPPPSPVVVFVAASDPTYTAVHCRRSCVSGGSKPPLEQSAACRHVSSNVHCFLESPQDLPFFPDHFPHNCCLHLVLYSVHLAVMYFRPL